MKNEPWKKCPGCLCQGTCPPRGLEGCIIMGCAGRADEPKENKEVRNEPI